MKVAIERTALEQEPAMMLGRVLDRPLHFELMALPATAERLSRLAMAGMLVSHRHNYSDQLGAKTGDSNPRAIRRVTMAIEEDPMKFRTVGQIAHAAGLSARALEVGFRRHVGVPPMRYLRQIRRARRAPGGRPRDGDSDVGRVRVGLPALRPVRRGVPQGVSPVAFGDAGVSVTTFARLRAP
ncbi:hypothetical protein AB0878_17510 [Amycolatopsis sp. NPDC047767]|uniref:hypothetical protein n=1 Tax=Amycolatopsis sp. NPDC047767 TaxID=3156765 RepID=UPI003454F0CA